MKKIITLIVLIALLVSTLVTFIPKDLPTDEQWKEYLDWEEEFLLERDTYECLYQIQHKETYEVYFIGTLQECKDTLTSYPNSNIMPYLK